MMKIFNYSYAIVFFIFLLSCSEQKNEKSYKQVNSNIKPLQYRISLTQIGFERLFEDTSVVEMYPVFKVANYSPDTLLFGSYDTPYTE